MRTEYKGCGIYYNQLGEGREVILLHGWGYDSSLLMPLAQFLSAFCRVTLIDLPGHGQSDQPIEPMDIYDFAGAVKCVMDEADIKSASFIGHSNGGRTILAMSRDYGQCFEKLVLCDSAGIRPKRTLKYYIKVYWYKLIKNIMRLPIFTQESRERFKKNRGSEDYRKLSDVMRATFSRIVNEDLKYLLKDIKAPTLLIWGDKDTDTPPYMAEILKENIPDCGLVMYSGAGHYAFLERLGQTERVLESFLK
ncbi:MAG TPA: alpha/beta hydrolase [Firmicutes bacterium]|nr:alpha/beta hydrolase [Bacillota bacterium]